MSMLESAGVAVFESVDSTASKRYRAIYIQKSPPARREWL